VHRLHAPRVNKKDKTRINKIEGLMDGLMMRDDYSRRLGARESDDIKNIFEPVFEKIVSLFSPLKFWTPIEGADITAVMGAHTRKGKGDASVGVHVGLDNSLMEFEFKSGRWAPATLTCLIYVLVYLVVCVCVCVCVCV
jgi:hypothetical protein